MGSLLEGSSAKEDLYHLDQTVWPGRPLSCVKLLACASCICSFSNVGQRGRTNRGITLILSLALGPFGFCEIQVRQSK